MSYKSETSESEIYKLHQKLGYMLSEKYNPKKYNKYDLTGKFGIGYTSKGEEFYFDLEDYDKIKNHLWYKDKDGGLICTEKRHTIQMHRIIMNVTDKSIMVDHIHHNRYDNRKSELRLCYCNQNNWNKKMNKRNTSGCTGVHWVKKSNKWKAQINVNKHRYMLGMFEDYDDAVNARKKAEEYYYGEFKYQEESK